MKKSQRITIRSHNIEFLKTIGAQMGITDLAEICNYLILDCKGLGYAFGNKPQPQPQQAQTPIGYTFDTSTFESVSPLREADRNQYEIDPMVAHIASLIEEF